MRAVAMERWHGQELTMSLRVAIFLSLARARSPSILPSLHSTRRVHVMSNGSFDVTVWIPCRKAAK